MQHDLTQKLKEGVPISKKKWGVCCETKKTYYLMNCILFKKDLQGVLLRCIKLGQILHQFHEGSIGGHFLPRAIALRVMKVGYYWPNVFKDAHSWVRKCKRCSIFAGKDKLAVLPLQPIQVDQTFMKWGLDFIGLINPPSSVGHKWVLTATDCFTKWT